MKSTIKKTSLESIPFPKLMEDKEVGIILLMTSPKSGMVIHSKGNNIGIFSHEWDDKSLTPYEGTIELSNY